MRTTPLPIFCDATHKGPAGAPWFEFRNEAGQEHAEILIYDQIGKDWWTDEGVGAKEFAEQLSKIPKGRKIMVGINSGGGNVHDGMAIYSLLQARKDDVTCRVDGVAASIASVIALAGKELRMPRNALLMIHDPWGFCQGGADEMRRMADALDKHKDAIVAVYTSKTGRTKADVSAKMSAETWFTGDDAREYGLADVISNEITVQASHDFSRFRHVPSALLNQRSHPMNKAQILALLRKHGITIADNATKAQLLAALATLPASEQESRTQAEAFVNALPNDAPATPPPATTQSSAAAGTDDIRAELNRVTAHLERERRDRIARAIDQCIIEDRIPGAQREAWIADAMRDESILARVQALPSRPPGTEPVSVEIRAESGEEVIRALTGFRAPIASMLRGNDVSPESIRNGAMAIANVLRKEFNRLLPFLNANTIPSDLKRVVILQAVLRDFKRRIVPLGAFSTTFSNVPLQGTDEVVVPYFPLYTSASKDFVQNDGYVFDKNTTTSSKKVTVNKRKYQPFNFNSAELRRQPYFDVQRLAMLMAEQLGIDVFNDVLSVVTAANFGAAVKAEPASAFDSDDIADIATVADKSDWPEVGRSLILDSAYKGNLLKDPDLKNVDRSGSDQTLRNGSIGRVSGFDIIPCSRIPANGENLKGMAVFQSAILVATSPIQPAPGVRSQLVSYDLVVDPDSGIAFEYRYWGNADKDEDREVIEANYGYVKGQSDANFAVAADLTPTAGNSNALMRITSQ